MEQVVETSAEQPTQRILNEQIADRQFNPMVLALLVGLLLAVIFFVLRRRASGRRDFLLTGLCESGKSAIFMRIMFNQFPDTLTSMTENVGEYRSGRMSCRLVDIPGHYRVRNKYFDQYKRTAKGLVYVVDAVTAQKDIRDLADALYGILIDAAIASCPILVLCNKQDLTTAKSAQIIKTLLEREMNIVRDTRSRKLQAVGETEDGSKSAFLGREGKDFEFSQLQQNVQFFECSAKNNELSNLSDWLDRML